MPLGVSGFETKIDQKVVQSPRLLMALNVEMPNPGAISKRKGYQEISHSTIQNDYDIEPQGLGIRAGNLVGIGNHDFISEYSPTLEKWTEVTNQRTPITEARVVKSSKEFEYFATDSVWCNGLLFAVGIEKGETTDSAELYVFDGESETLLHSQVVVQMATGTFFVKLAVIGNNVYAFHIDGSNLYVKSIVATAAGLAAGLSGQTALKTNVSGNNKQFDVHYQETRVYVVYCVDGESDYLVTFTMNDSKSVVNTHIWPGGYIGTGFPIAVYHHATQARVITIATSYSRVLYSIYDESLNQLFTGTASTDTEIKFNVIGISTGPVPGQQDWFGIVWEIVPENGGSPFEAVKSDVKWRKVDISTGAAIGSISTAFNVNLAHKAAEDVDSSVFGIFREISLLEGAIAYTVQLNTQNDIVPIAKYKYGLAAGRGVSTIPYMPKSFVPGIAVETEGIKWHWSLILRKSLKTFTGFYYGNLSVGIATYEINHANTYQNVEFGNNMPYAKSIPAFWDSEHDNEIGFSHPPTIKTIVGSAGGSIGTGTYYYVAVYEYMDAFGQLHRSAPSLPIAFTVMLPVNQVTVSTYTPVRNRNLVSLAGGNMPIVAIYRTFANSAGPFFRVTPQERPGEGQNFNDRSVDTFLDDKVDLTISTNELLYTTGDVLANYPPPPTQVMALHQNRLWVISTEDGALYHSKEFLAGDGIAFHLALQISTNVQKERPVALCSIGHALVVFWKNSIGIVYGDGPNDLGVGGTYTLPQMIPGNIGCWDRRSVVKAPDGVMFMSEQGVYLLPNSLGPPQYIGAPIEAYTPAPITGAYLMENENQVFFRHYMNLCLIYNYYLKQWIMWQGPEPAFGQIVASALYDNQETLVLQYPENKIYQQDTSGNVFIDGGESNPNRYYPMAFMTPWIKLGGLIGYQRIWKAFLLGDKGGQHDLKVHIEYDYGGLPSDDFTFEWAELNTLDPYEVEIQIPKQKCTAIQFVVWVDCETEEYDSEGPTFSALRLQYGVKRGSARLPIAARQ